MVADGTVTASEYGFTGPTAKTLSWCRARGVGTGGKLGS